MKNIVNKFVRIDNHKATMSVEKLRIEIFTTEISILNKFTWIVENDEVVTLKKNKSNDLEIISMNKHLDKYYRKMKIENPRVTKKRELAKIRKEQKTINEAEKMFQKMKNPRKSVGYTYAFDITNQCFIAFYTKGGLKNLKKRIFSLKKYETKEKALIAVKIFIKIKKKMDNVA